MENVLEVRNLTKHFGARKVVDSVSFDVPKGEVVGFIGPNGAGKTTVIKMILGFLNPDEGTVKINGFDTFENYEEAMGCAGGIVENPDMYKQFSGRLNLEMYARMHEGVTKERIDEVIKLVGLENRIDEHVKKYSLGMKQRLGLAQAILSKPKLLILDEPTNGLDPAGISELRKIVRTLAAEEGVGVLVSSHQLAEMQLMCDRVAVISNGRVLCRKTMEEMKNISSEEIIYRIEVSDGEKAAALFGDNTNVKLIENNVLEATFKADGNVNTVLKNLIEGEIEIYGVTKEKKTLEEAFLAVTGGGNTIA